MPIDFAGRDDLGEVHRDGAGSTPHVEQAVAALEMREEEAGRVLRRAPRVAAQDRLVMTMGVAIGWSHFVKIHSNAPPAPVVLSQFTHSTVRFVDER